MLWAQIVCGMFFMFSLVFVSCDSRTLPGASSTSAGAPTPISSGEEDPTNPPTSPSEPTPTPSGDCADVRPGYGGKEIVEQVCELVNQERAKVGVGTLKLDAALSQVAQAYAEDMVRRGYFSHTSPEGLGPADRLQAGQISYRTWGENIAYYYKTPEAVMTGWMNSSGHKANILNGKFGKIGVGYYQNYWVQDFTD